MLTYGIFSYSLLILSNIFYQCNNLSLRYHLIPSSEREENQPVSSCLHPFQRLLVGASVPGWWRCERRVKSCGSRLSGGSSCSREMRQWKDSPIFSWLLSSAIVHCRLLITEPRGQRHTAERWRFHSARCPTPWAAEAQGRCPTWETGRMLGPPVDSDSLCQPVWMLC